MKEEIKEFLMGIKEGQKNFGKNLAIIINSILLTIVYFLGIGLTSIFLKIFGKNFLETKIEISRESYWKELNLNKEPMNNYFRQF